MLQTLISKTWKAPRRTGMEKLLQQQTEQVLLTYLLNLSVNTSASFQAIAEAKQALNNLKAFIIVQKKASRDAAYTAHLLLAIDRMSAPEDAKPTLHKEIAPGSPIGCDMEF